MRQPHAVGGGRILTLRSLGASYSPNITPDSATGIGRYADGQIKRYPFEFPTGEAEIYNNSAFWLLGLVVEKASGMAYEDYVEKKLFEPLGMKRSMYCNSAENVEWPFSAGSLCSTAGDLRFDGGPDSYYILKRQ